MKKINAVNLFVFSMILIVLISGCSKVDKLNKTPESATQQDAKECIKDDMPLNNADVSECCSKTAYSTETACGLDPKTDIVTCVNTTFCGKPDSKLGKAPI